MLSRPAAPAKTLAAIGLALVLAGTSSASLAQDQEVTKTWALAEFGEPLYQDGFEHWPYANPDAPKGGRITQGAFGSYDSLNSIILKGQPEQSIGLIEDTLMVPSGDELSVVYGLLAESAEYPEDKSWIIFNLRPEARWHDGEPITAGDIAYGFEMIQEHGRPFLKSFFEDVESVEVLSDHRVKFTFKTRDNMKPLLKVAQLSPLPRHYWESRDISKTTLEPPLGSSSYRVKSLEPGRSITYERVNDYWGADLPVNRGLGNFDEIRYDYYRDLGVMFEAFKAGKIDFRNENSSKRWATGYDIKPVKSGEIIKREIPDEMPQGIQAFFFNLRKPQFEDPRVREAIGLLYDFEAIRRTLLYNQYARTNSYFPNSDFGASGPPTEVEIAILKPFADQLAPEVLSTAWEPPKTDGSGNIRSNLRKALALFKEAGWTVKGGKLVNGATGAPMTMEILLVQPDGERLTAPFVENLKRAGIDAKIRIVDSAQYRERIDDRDFDVITVRLNFFPPPGPELRSYYGTEAADIRGSANMAGIKNPVADALIEQIVEAKDLESLKATSRALDRVLLWNNYIIPQFYNDQHRVAYRNRFGYPETRPKYATGFPGAWWIDGALDSKLSKTN